MLSISYAGLGILLKYNKTIEYTNINAKLLNDRAISI
jgi:hypothetical protein